MARPKKLNNTKELTCKNNLCNKVFSVKKYKNIQFCSHQCSQTYKSYNKDWLKKRDITNIEKYGVKSPLESKQVLENYKNSLIKKYGVNNPFLVKEFKDKSDSSKLKKYGVLVPSMNKDIALKISKSLKSRTVPKNRENFVNIKWEKILNYCKETNLEPLFDKDTINNNFVKDLNLKFKCIKCTNIMQVSIDNGYLPTCSKCSSYKGYSLIEEEITKFIQENYDGEIQLKKKHLISKGYEIDIYLPQINLAIEVNGIYWHSEIWGKYKDYHLFKTQKLLEKDIQLLHIWDREWLHKKEIVKSIILNKLNKITNRIYARKCEIKEINKIDKELFLNNSHIQGNCVSKTNLGLYYNNELVSIMTFGKNRFKKDNSIELLRFCNKLNTTVIGGASKLFNYFIQNYKPERIITFADRRYSLGKLYPILGFNFVSYTSPSYFYWKSDKKVLNRISCQKHKLKDLLPIFDNNLSEYENMLKNGWNRVWDCGNYKFEWITPPNIIPLKLGIE